MAKRSQYSIRLMLVEKAREAALTAVQAYNNPLTRFKSESFIVLMMVAWTYLLHAHFRQSGVEYRYYTQTGKRRRFQRNPNGTFRYWDLMECVSAATCPLDGATVANLRFLHDLRNEIEHHMPPGMDDYLASRYLACVMNFEYWLTTLFGEEHSLREHVAPGARFRTSGRSSRCERGAPVPVPATRHQRRRRTGGPGSRLQIRALQVLSCVRAARGREAGSGRAGVRVHLGRRSPGGCPRTRVCGHQGD